jgi:hypothetical protein
MSDFDEDWDNQDFHALALAWINEARFKKDGLLELLSNLKAPDKKDSVEYRNWEDQVLDIEYQIEELEEFISSNYDIAEEVYETGNQTQKILVGFSERLARKLSNISNHDSEEGKLPTNYKIYIIEIQSLTSKDDYVFYVGSTSHEVEYRISQHQNVEAMAARMFKNGSYQIKAVRSDLHDSLPRFHSVRAAEKAEGIVADFLCRRGFPAYSDQGEFAALRRRKK